MKNLSIVLTSIFILSLAGCGLSARTKVLYPEPTNDAQELANYVVAQNFKCEGVNGLEKNCYSLVDTDFSTTGEIWISTSVKVRVVFNDKERRLLIDRSTLIVSNNEDQEWVEASFMDKNIDGVVDVYVSEKRENHKMTKIITYADKKVSKNNGEYVDATAEEIKLFQDYYNSSVVCAFSDLYETYRSSY